MARRVLLGKESGSDFVLKISKPGDDIIDDTINDRDLLFNSEIYRAGIIRSNTSFTSLGSGSYKTFESTTDANGNHYIPAYLISENGTQFATAVFDYGYASVTSGEDYYGRVVAGLPTGGGGGLYEFSLASSGSNRNRLKLQYINIADADDPRPGQNTGYPFIEDRSLSTSDSVTVKVDILGIPCQYGKMVNNTTVFGNSLLTGTASGGGGGSGGTVSAPADPTVTFVSRTSTVDNLTVTSTAGTGNTATIQFIATTAVSPVPNIAASGWQTSGSFTQPRGTTRWYWAKQGSFVSDVNAQGGYVSPAYDNTPTAFDLGGPQTNAALNTYFQSAEITVAGLDNSDFALVSVTGAQLSKNQGAYTTNGTIAVNGDDFRIRVLSSSSNGTSTSGTLTIGTVSDTYQVSTGQDTTVDSYDFTNQNSLELSTLVYSNTETITGISTGVSVSISGNSAEFSINGGSYGTSGTITNNQTLRLRMNTSGSFSTNTSTTVNVGGVTDTWTITTRGQTPVTTPGSITATQITNTTATAQTVDATAAHQFLGSGTLQVSNNNSTYSANGTDFSQNRNTTVTYYARSLGGDGNTSSTINVDKFVPPVVTVGGIGNFVGYPAAGFNYTYSVSVQRGQGNYNTYSSYWGTTTTSISNNSGGWLSTSITNSSAGNFNLTATANTTGSARTATVTYTTSTTFGASHTMTFTVNQLALDGVPDQFTFTDLTNQSLSSLAYASATITGIATTVTASYSGDTGGFRIGNSGSYTTADKTLTNNQVVQVQLSTSASHGTSTNATITIGGVSDTFTATTIAADTTPNSFTFIDQPAAAANTLVYTNIITIAGINTSVTASISGNSAEMQVNSGSYTSSNQTISVGDTIRLRMTSSATAGATVNTTLTVGGTSDTWSVTTTTATLLWSVGLALGSFSAFGFLSQGFSTYIGGGHGTATDTSCDLYNGQTTWGFSDQESSAQNTFFHVSGVTSNSGWTTLKIYNGTSNSATLLATRTRSSLTYSNSGGSFASWDMGSDLTGGTGNLFLEFF
jgi:hypothetical protein